MFASRLVCSKSQRKKFLRLPVHQDPRCLVVHLDQIGRESVSAVSVVYQLCELIVCDRFLVVFENVPFRFCAEDADVVRSLERCCEEEQKN